MWVTEREREWVLTVTRVEAVVLASNLDSGLSAADDPALGAGTVAVVAIESEVSQPN